MKTIKLILPVFLLCTITAFSQAKATAKPIGNYIREGATCEGLQFISDEVMNMIDDERTCRPWTLRTKWLDDKTFYAVEDGGVNPKCPPRVLLYTIISHDGKILKLKEHWTGWDDSKDEVVVYKKK